MKNAWIELDLEVFRDNLRSIRRALSPRAALILVVKARAYGHGLEAIARCAREQGVQWFVVSNLEEALTLREAVSDAVVLLLGAALPNDTATLLGSRIVPVLVSHSQAQGIAAAARSHGCSLPCHIKIDTGMGRFGLDWADAAQQILALHREGGLRIEGLCTHFASAGRKGDDYADRQAQRFQQVVNTCAANGLKVPCRHIANSAAFLKHPEWDLTAVRCGILAYGYGGRYAGARATTRPFMQWKTRVIQVRRVPAGFPVSYLSTYVTQAPTVLAMINVGYADGFARQLSNRGLALLGGRRVPVVGRVTMNFSVLDAGPEAQVREGDEVVLMGEQGGEAIWADELARWCKTIPYEILTSIRSTPA